MRTVVLQVYDYSLDGIFGEEDTEFYKYCRSRPDHPDHERWIVESIRRADVNIMGRVTYQGMERFFPTAAGPLADAMNAMPRAVFSRTLTATDWPGTTILRGDTGTELENLCRQGDGEILAHGGLSFARSLINLDAVDEYRLSVYPHLAATGQRLFDGLPAPHGLELGSSTTYGDGLVALTYLRRR